jgi:hypothetical protein
MISAILAFEFGHLLGGIEQLKSAPHLPQYRNTTAWPEHDFDFSI